MDNKKSTNTMSIVGLVLAILLPLIGIIVSVISYMKAKKAGEKDNIAMAGIVVGVLMMFVSVGLSAWLLSSVDEVTDSATSTIESGVEAGADVVN